ncbi:MULTISPECIES: hypothetical protein [Pseudomonas]|jgi:hypothetical protein|uniref:hypothetical protein n=1 Tax=Pseudomonas TaxID=286 RepID=UPI0018D8FD13|nr:MULTISPECIES: hypothetical protein [Pseudomonas]MBH3373401.1 hypothetical protein [Pseudomonas juntendi]MBS6039451.1 hypothetical protein [Pseudomonas sp.]CAH0646794.1 hypothetical protein PSNVIR_01044 [Pseudomonas sp. Nvir]
MASFADIFSQENVGNLMSDPRLQLGLALMAQGRQGSSSQAIGQAGSRAVQLMGEQRRAQELAQYRQQMTALQQQQMQMRQQAADAKAAQQAQYQERVQDPSFLDQLSPTARQMAGLGVSPDDLIRAIGVDNLAAHRDASLAQQQSQFATRESRIGANGGSAGPRMPTQRQVLEKPIGNGMVQKFLLDPATGEYQEYGQPYAQYSPGRKAKADATGADAVVQQVMGNGPTAAEALPGTGSIESYKPQPQQPVGVLPMAASGGGMANPALKAATADTRVPGQPKIATPMTKAEYDALPPGARYIDPVSGKTATKRG